MSGIERIKHAELNLNTLKIIIDAYNDDTTTRDLVVSGRECEGLSHVAHYGLCQTDQVVLKLA